MAASQWFVRAVHRFVAALTAPDAGGALYAIDMRLRPSGNKGPVAVSLAAFEHYHRPGGEAWTWERMALTRARVLAATPAFSDILSAAILGALRRPVSAAITLADTVTMLKRVNAEFQPAGLWDVKYCPGGMIELAFIAEALLLIHGPANPELFRFNTAAAIRALALAGHLDEPDAQTLIKADFLWRTIQGITRITGMRDTDDAPPEALLAPLLRATGAIDLAELRAAIAHTGKTVRSCFQRYIEPAT
jgi:glutamate-ammonia-ligase adenylyltransferase